MRITNQMMANQLLLNINRNLGLLNKYNTQGSTGKKIQNPSDDPIIASRALRFRTILAENEQYIKNSEQADSWLEVTESAIQNINSIATKMKELCQQGASDTYSLNDRQKILTEYNSLLEQLEQELNTTYMGRYVFSGYKTNTPPIQDGKLNSGIYKKLEVSFSSNEFSFNEETGELTVTDIANINSGDKITINGVDYTYKDTGAVATQNEFSTEEQFKELLVGNGIIFDNGILTPVDYSNVDGQYITLQVGSGVNISVNSFATSLYSSQDYGIFHTFGNIEEYINSQEFLDLTDEEKVKYDEQLREKMSSMITTIDNYLSKVSTQHTEVGVKIKKIELIQTRLKNDETNYTELMSNNEDIDLAEVMMRYNTANAAYQASLKIGMTITQLSLADYL